MSTENNENSRNENEDEDLADIMEDPVKYKEWFMTILEPNKTKLSQKIYNKLLANEIDDELDLNLRRLSEREPYNMLIPSLRDKLNLSIKNDTQCIESLELIREHLTKKEDLELINTLIDFIKSSDGELPEDIVPEIDLLMMINDVPVEKFTLIYNCIDYIKEITEDQ